MDALFGQLGGAMFNNPQSFGGPYFPQDTMTPQQQVDQSQANGGILKMRQPGQPMMMKPGGPQYNNPMPSQPPMMMKPGGPQYNNPMPSQPPMMMKPVELPQPMTPPTVQPPMMMKPVELPQSESFVPSQPMMMKPVELPGFGDMSRYTNMNQPQPQQPSPQPQQFNPYPDPGTVFGGMSKYSGILRNRQTGLPNSGFNVY